MQEGEIKYRFIFKNETEREYLIKVNPATGVAIPEGPPSVAEWTKLEVCKCSHCPLNQSQNPNCPVAVGLERAITAFKDEVSHHTVEVRVETAARTYSKTLSLQEGLFGLFGLIMATNSCPHMDFLRPMARFHLPFSSLDETIIRSTSFYLLKQLMIQRNGGKPDWELKDFKTAYEQVQLVNQGIIARIRKMKTKGDADQNAIIMLDSFAALLSMEISQDFQSFKDLFITKA